jgi:hypothetical protein
MIPKRFQNEITKHLRDETRVGALCWVNENMVDTIHKNIYALNFTRMYPNIILKIYDGFDGWSDSIQSGVEELRILVGHGDGMTREERIQMNSFFAGLCNPYNEYNRGDSRGIYLGNSVIRYGSLIGREIVSMYVDNIVYIDTSTIYFRNLNEFPIKDLDYGLPYTIDEISRGAFYGKKRYIIHDGEVKTKGMKGEYWVGVEKNVRKRFIRELRSEKLGSILWKGTELSSV